MRLGPLCPRHHALIGCPLEADAGEPASYYRTRTRTALAGGTGTMTELPDVLIAYGAAYLHDPSLPMPAPASVIPVCAVRDAGVDIR